MSAELIQQMLDALPVRDLLVFSAPAFVLGIGIGWAWERGRRRITSGDHMKPLPVRAREVYDRLAPALFVVLLIVGVVGVWLGFTATIVNGRQDAIRAHENEVRDKQSSTLLACFDRFADALTDALPPVREASAKRDEAQAFRDAALQHLVAVLGGGDRQVIAAAVARLKAAGDALEAAQGDLTEARKANPYPDPPSTFCN